MEDDRNFVSLPPSPCLAFIHGNENEILTLCPTSQGEDPVEKNTPHDLLNKFIGDCFYGWLVVWDEQGIHYSLWSPAQTIHLPPLTLKPEQEIDHKILTSPPGNSDSMLILFEITGPSFIYCKVGDEQQQWKEQVVSLEFKGNYLFNPIFCNGKIYCENIHRRDKLGLIDIKSDCLSFSLIDPAFVNVPWEFRRVYMVESGGEIFSIYLLLNGYLSIGCAWEEVIDVHVYKLDLSRREWERVYSFKDRAFFLGTSTSSKFSCPATQSGIKGNHVYFQLSCDVNLYSYNMEDGTILFSIPCPNLLPEQCSQSFWIMSDLRLMKDAEHEMNSNPDDRGGETKSNSREIVKHSAVEEGAFCKLLPSEILAQIARFLIRLEDYMSFRSINTTFRLAAPLTEWRRDFSLPWLMFRGAGNGIWNFVDLLVAGRYVMASPNNNFEDATLCFSKGGWCVMLHGEDSVFLWNPFAKKIIPLPNIQVPNLQTHHICDRHTVIGCGFSSSPDSSESDCTIVLLFNLWEEYRINFINLGGDEWKSYSFKANFELITFDRKSNPVLYNGAFYFLDLKGNLGVYRGVDEEQDENGEGQGHEDDNYDEEEDDDDVDVEEDDDDEDEDEDEEEEDDDEEEEDEDGEDKEEEEEEEEEDDHEVLDHVVQSPCESFHQKFLIECDGELLSVFVGMSAEWVKIFKFNESEKVWVEVEDLGNHTLYLSRYSAFSTMASPGLRNRIFFPRFYRKSCVYYCLESNKLHSYGTEEVLENFDGTKEQTLCGWITPKF